MASQWLEDGMNIVQISFLLGHEQLQTTMVYLEITTEQEAKALATLEDENDKKVSKKWKDTKGGLTEFCGVKAMKKWKKSKPFGVESSVFLIYLKKVWIL